MVEKYYEEDLVRLYKTAARILAMREELSKILLQFYSRTTFPGSLCKALRGISFNSIVERRLLA